MYIEKVEIASNLRNATNAELCVALDWLMQERRRVSMNDIPMNTMFRGLDGPHYHNGILAAAQVGEYWYLCNMIAKIEREVKRRHCLLRMVVDGYPHPEAIVPDEKWLEYAKKCKAAVMPATWGAGYACKVIHTGRDGSADHEP